MLGLLLAPSLAGLLVGLASCLLAAGLAGLLALASPGPLPLAIASTLTRHLHQSSHVAFVGLAAASALLTDVLLSRARKEVATDRARTRVALAVKALGPQHVFGVLMPDRDSSADSLRLGRQWARSLGIETALEGGVTSMQILPGSGNLVGGRGVTVKNVPATTYQAMKFPGAKQGLKMACGENPKRFYGGQGRAPMTRMGNVAGYRQAFADAQEYQRSLDKYEREKAAWEKKQGGKRKGKDEGKADAAPTPPKQDLRLETLAAAMRGDVLVHIHCYRADEMAIMIDLADEFGFRIAAFHHGVEAYKLADTLAERGICGALWADWWGFKMEAYDGIQENLALVDRPKNGCAIVHSDSAEGIQRLNQEAAKAMMRGNRAGLAIAPEHAIRWVTANPAHALGIEDRTGTLEAGKMGDVVIWNRDPFSVYALAEQVFVDGALMFDRAHPAAKPRSDFMLGQPGAQP